MTRETWWEKKRYIETEGENEEARIISLVCPSPIENNSPFLNGWVDKMRVKRKEMKKCEIITFFTIHPLFSYLYHLS